ncbi:MAG: hypothetical protein ABEH86_07720 [Haloarcula sp.]
MSSYRRDAGFAVLCSLVLVAYLVRAGAVDTLRAVPVTVVGVVATACWGLATYFVLLAGMLTHQQ